MRKWAVIAIILAVGAAVLVPVVILVDPAPLMGVFHLTWGKTRLNIPVFWSLCASAALGLFYFVMKR